MPCSQGLALVRTGSFPLRLQSCRVRNPTTWRPLCCQENQGSQVGRGGERDGEQPACLQLFKSPSRSPDLTEHRPETSTVHGAPCPNSQDTHRGTPHSTRPLFQSADETDPERSPAASHQPHLLPHARLSDLRVGKLSHNEPKSKYLTSARQPRAVCLEFSQLGRCTKLP